MALYRHRNFTCSYKNTANNSNSENWKSFSAEEVSQYQKEAWVVSMPLIVTTHLYYHFISVSFKAQEQRKITF